MNHILRGITYSYNRNIGWQDRAFRSLVGMGALIGSFYYLSSNLLLSIGLAILFIAQLVTVVPAKCIILYFVGGCTIGTNEKHALDKKGIAHQ